MEERFPMPPSPEITSPESPESDREITIPPGALVFLAGIPGSGKSTFAMRNFPLDAVVNADRIRAELTNNPQNQLVSRRAFAIAERIVSERLQRGAMTVVDAMNIDDRSRQVFMDAAERSGAQVEVIYLDVALETAVARDACRARSVGRGTIAQMHRRAEAGKRALAKSSQVDVFHVLGEREIERTRVTLPDAETVARAADQELIAAAEDSATFIMAAETGFLEREHAEAEFHLSIDAGSVVMIDHAADPDVRTFLAANFLPHQVIDVQSIAQRISAGTDNGAVGDVAELILRERLHLNLTTVIASPDQPQFEDRFRDVIRRVAEDRKIRIPTPTIRVAQGTPDASSDDRDHGVTSTLQCSPRTLACSVVDVQREGNDVPLFLIGDVQGCYQAMRELAGNIRQENLDRDARTEPLRHIVFVGDMSDRGPYDAEAAIYITALVRSGRATLVLGNHDVNLLRGLRGENVVSSETQSTVAEIQRRLKPESVARMIEMLEQAPVVANWRNLTVAHASLPRIPRSDETLTEKEQHIITHGARSGQFVGGRSEVWKLPYTVSHDPEVLVVGGHTHEVVPLVDRVSGSAVLDVSAEVKGKLWGMYFPELELRAAEEPDVTNMYERLKSGVLPQGQELLTFLAFSEQQSFIQTKRGLGTFEGLTLVTYSRITDATSAWEEYPTLRHFRGLIVADDGTIVARPFAKTHKAGVEIPLEELDIVPEKVFEKANGSLGIAYFWKGAWRIATKFSFANEGYTKPAEEMLAAMRTDALDPAKTYCFEIILPEDPHIVDYGGERKLILLNAIDPATGTTDPWDEVGRVGDAIGASTATDFSAQFAGMTIAEISAYAQEPGNVQNLEGFMAIYRDPDTGAAVTVKVKAREYDEKKFVRDRLDWEDLLAAVDPITMDVLPERRETLLAYNTDNVFANAAIDARVAWIQERHRVITTDLRVLLATPLAEARIVYDGAIAAGGSVKDATDVALRAAFPRIDALTHGTSGGGKERVGVFMGCLRNLLSDGAHADEHVGKYVLARLREEVKQETVRRGKNAFWVVPERERPV